MKKTHLFFSILMAAVLCLASTSWAGEASVFDSVEKIIIRAYTMKTCSNDATISCTLHTDCPGGACNSGYSAFIEVRDAAGALVPCDGPADNKCNKFAVSPVLETPSPIVTTNPFIIHNNDLSNPDISMSFDSVEGITYLFCMNESLHVMAYKINNVALSIPGECGTANHVPSSSAPTTNLCNYSSTTPSAVNNGSGLWTWSCTGLNSVSTDYCTAAAPLNGACGTAKDGTFSSAPTTNLCNYSSTTPSAVNNGSGLWTWSCTGLNSVSTTANCTATVQSSSGTPDLGFDMSWGQVSGVSTQSGGSNGQQFSETVTINNTGNAPAGSFKVKVWMSPTPNITQNSVLLYTLDVSSLAAGQSLTRTLSPLSFSGMPVHSYYYLITKIDADNQVTESNEASCGFPPGPTTGCNTYYVEFFIYR